MRKVGTWEGEWVATDFSDVSPLTSFKFSRFPASCGDFSPDLANRDKFWKSVGY